jgi:hypothetical protein
VRAGKSFSNKTGLGEWWEPLESLQFASFLTELDVIGDARGKTMGSC